MVTVVEGVMINGKFHNKDVLKSECYTVARLLGLKPTPSVIGTTMLQQAYFILGTRNHLYFKDGKRI